MASKDTPDHAVLSEPWSYTLEEFRYVSPEDFESQFIELTLRKGNRVCKLRFNQPRALHIEAGFNPRDYLGLEILDISAEQWEGAKVEVGCFEGVPSLHFYARDVRLIE